MDTCVQGDGSACSLDASDCVSPLELGSHDEGNEKCEFNYASRRRRLIGQAGDDGYDDYNDDGSAYDDDQPTSDISQCTPIWPFGVRFSQALTGEVDWHLKMPFTAYKAFRQVLSVRYSETYAHENMPSIFCGDCSTLDHLAGPYQSFRFTVTVTNKTSTYSIFPDIKNLVSYNCATPTAPFGAAPTRLDFGTTSVQTWCLWVQC